MNKYSLKKRSIQVVLLVIVAASFFTVYKLATERIAQLEIRSATEIAQIQATVTVQAALLTTLIKADTLQETAVATPNLQVTPDISSSVVDEPQPTENNQETLAYRLAHEAVLTLNEEPAALERGVLLAVEAVQRYPSVQTMQRLREGISLLRPRKLTIYSDDFFAHFTHSPDGRFIAVFNIDKNQVHVFSVENGDEIARLSYENPNRPLNIDSMVFSQNGEYLAGVDGVGWDNNTVIVWELSTGDAIWQHSEQNTNISALAFNDDNVHFGFIARGQIMS